jgi:hypothetical protein
MAMARSNSLFAIHEASRSRYEAVEDAREFCALTFAGPVTSQSFKIKPREILGLSIVSPLTPAESLSYGRQAGPNCSGQTPALEWARSCK